MSNIPLNIDWQQILLHFFNFSILVGGLYLLLTLLASAGVRALDQRLPKQGIPLR